MKKLCMSLLLLTPLVCNEIESNNTYGYFIRCENDEVICYDYVRWGGGFSCHWKEIAH